MIEKLTIRDVHQTAVSSDRIDVYFTIATHTYMLAVVEKEKGMYVPRMVFHETTGPCPFCQKEWKSSDCSTLNEQIETLFHRLVEYPNIRLEWLFLNHAY